MRRLFVALVVAALAATGVWYVGRSRADLPETGAWRLAKIDRGDISAAVSATGTINPVTTVLVGSQLSGLVTRILVDFNSEVKAGDVVARLDDTQVRARLDGARADLAQAEAQVLMQRAQARKNIADTGRAEAQLADMRAQFARMETMLADAEKTFERQSELSRRGVATPVALQAARTALESARSQRASAEAQIASAQASLASLAADAKVIEAQIAAAEATALQRRALVRQVEVDLSNTEIRSPVDGVVVQRQVELGQSVAASLQAPTLFQIAQDLRTMEIYANVDETDVGRVAPGQRVSFTVNAYPGRAFEGRLKIVRLGSQTVQNVVIYTAIVAVENPRLELRPGMTANLRILTEHREAALRAPNAGLRWRPPGPAVEAPAPQQGGLFEPPPRLARAGAGPPGGQGARALTELAEAIKLELRPEPAQREKIDAILAGAGERMREAFAGEANPAERRERLRAARAELARDIAAVLTAEQKPLFEALRERMAGARRDAGERRQTGQAGRVFVVGADGQPRAVALRLGATDGAFTEILGGALKEGEEIIVGAAPKAASSNPFHLRLF